MNDDDAPGMGVATEEETAELAGMNGQANLIERLRAARREQEKPHYTVITIPGYEGLMGVRYKYVSAERIEQLSKKLQREIRKTKAKAEGLLASLDTVIAACEEIVIRGSDDEEWQSLGDPPIRFDDRLAETLGYEADNARDAVLGCFNNEHAIIRHNILVSRWLADTTTEVDESFLGE